MGSQFLLRYCRGRHGCLEKSVNPSFPYYKFQQAKHLSLRNYIEISEFDNEEISGNVKEADYQNEIQKCSSHLKTLFQHLSDKVFKIRGACFDASPAFYLWRCLRSQANSMVCTQTFIWNTDWIYFLPCNWRRNREKTFAIRQLSVVTLIIHSGYLFWVRFCFASKTSVNRNSFGILLVSSQSDRSFGKHEYLTFSHMRESDILLWIWPFELPNRFIDVINWDILIFENR